MSESDKYGTPPDIIRRVKQVFGTIDLDPCGIEGHPIDPDTETVYLPQDGLAVDWAERTYCNPPFSNAKPWLVKASVEWRTRRCTNIVLTRAAMNCIYFHEYGLNSWNAMAIPKRRVSFLKDGVIQKGNMYDVVIGYHGLDVAAFMQAFDSLGKVIEL